MSITINTSPGAKQPSDLQYGQIQAHSTDLLAIGKADLAMIAPVRDIQRITEIKKQLKAYQGKICGSLDLQKQYERLQQQIALSIVDMQMYEKQGNKQASMQVYQSLMQLKDNYARMTAQINELHEIKNHAECLLVEHDAIESYSGFSFFRQSIKKHPKFTILYQKIDPTGPLPEWGSSPSNELVDQNMVYMMNVYCLIQVTGHDVSLPSDQSAKWGWVNNLGNAIFQEVRFKLNSGVTYLDELTTDTMNIESQLEMSREKQVAYEKMIGNIPELCEMQQSHSGFTLFVPFNFFFTYGTNVAFPSLALQNQPIYIVSKIRSLSELLCKSNSLAAHDFSDIQITNFKFITKDIMTEKGEAIQVTELNQQMLSMAHNSDKQQISTSGLNYTHDISLNANVLAKELVWYVKMDKYQGSKFLAYVPIYNKQQDTSELRQLASGRYVLKFAAYEASYTWTAGSSSFALNTVEQSVDGVAEDVADVSFAKSKQAENNASYFDVQHVLNTAAHFTDAPADQIVLASDYTIATAGATEKLPVAATWIQLQPVSLSGKGFSPNLIAFNGTLLSYAQLSETVTNIVSGYTWTTAPAFGSAGANTLLDALSADLQADQRIVFSYKGFSGANFDPVNTILLAANYVTFGVNNQRLTYNEGLDNFDVIVNQHDNYALYLNKTGETIDVSSLYLNNNKRFELPGFFTNTIIPFESHTNIPNDGIHVYSFALCPEQVDQPTGYSSFVKQSTQQKLQLLVAPGLQATSGTTINYKLNTYVRAYNILEIDPSVQHLAVKA